MNTQRSIFIRFIVPALLAVGIFSISPHTVQADGIVVPDPPPGNEPIPLQDSWLTIDYHRVDVKINNQISVTRIEQQFTNQHTWEAEATYLFPLPEGAVISDFRIWVDDKAVSSKLLSADQAREIYQAIVRDRKDPALLEYVGRGAVEARLYPIPAGASRRIDLEYTQILPVEESMVSYRYPLNTEKFSAQPLENCSIRVAIQSADPIRTVYSPTHQDRLFIQREGEYQALISYEELEILPTQDFDLIYTLSNQEIGLTWLLTPGSGEDPGTFLLMASPGIVEPEVVERDVLLVLDTSGSMEGEKLIQAKQALRYVLERLNPGDRFNLINFSSSSRAYSADLVPASEQSGVLEWIDNLSAAGGTDLNLALIEALQFQDKGQLDRPLIILFLTDGLPTEGVTDIQQILTNIRRETGTAVRIFSFGVGDDVNTILLDGLALENRGSAAYVRPQESILEEVSGLFQKIQRPVLTDLTLNFQGVEVDEIYPGELPDLFAGSQLIVTGRYSTRSSRDEAMIELIGYVNGKRRVYKYPVRVSKSVVEGDQAAAVSRLWAARKIGDLLTKIRLEGEREDWIQEVISLSIRYGIMTPYTSYLIEEDDILTSRGREQVVEEWLESPQQPAVGGKAVSQAEAEANLRSADSMSGSYERREEGASAGYALQVRGNKTFLLQHGVWVDSAYEPDNHPVKKFQFDSPEYYSLLADHPEWGKYLSIGPEVIFVSGETAVQIGLDLDHSSVPEGGEGLSGGGEPALLYQLTVKLQGFVLTLMRD
jgi:Ca-activated chloride channel family protein